MTERPPVPPLGNLPWRSALPYALAFLLAFGVYYAAYKRMDPVAQGDEPHYVIEALSVAHDGDRDLSDDYYDRSEVGGVLGLLGIDLHAYRYTSSRRLVSVHNVGLPVLLAPAARTNDLNWIRIELVLVGALGAMALLGVLRALRIVRGPLLYAVWASVAFSLPVLQFSSQVYPELPAATLILIALWIALSRRLTPTRALVAGAVASVLPWLHVRYFILAAALVVGIAVASGLREGSFTGQDRGRAWRAGGLAVAPLGASFLAMSLAFWSWYGSPLLNAQYRLPATKGFVHHDAPYLYQSAVGNTLGSGFGWLPIAPLHVLGVAALGLLVWRYRWWGLAGCLVAAAYLLQVSTGSPGYAYAARFLIPVIPLVAVPLALAVKHVRPARFAFFPLAILTWAFAVNGVRHAKLLYAPVPGDILHVPLAVRLHTLWPNVPAAPGDRYPDAVFVAGWIAAIAFVGWLFLEARRPRSLTGA